ncbi:MAG: MCE family protein [Verrucomicrobiae bacterium]|nr:MCE family protein [Verrucomicrobiae bacterium]
MSTSTNHFKLGVFLLAAATLLVGALLFLGAGRMFRPQVMFETYFDESVQGLEVGSTVRFRGVSVGTVRRIAFTGAQYQSADPIAERRPYVLVEFALDEREIGPEIALQIREDTEAQVRRGLRARLTQQGITGVAILELDIVDPVRNPPLPITWTPRYPRIPSTPSRFNRIFESTEQFFEKFREVDVAVVFTNINQALVSLRQSLEGADTPAISGQFTNLLAELRVTNERLGGLLAEPAWKELPGDAAQTLAGARDAIASLREQLERADLAGVATQATQTLRQVQNLAAGRDGELDEILRNLAALMENLRAVSELARQYPSFLIFGQPPAPKPTKP